MRACVANGDRLLDDAQLLEFEKPPASQYALSIIAQEEYSKAFLLYLVMAGVVPWAPYLLRAMRDHKCKHLIGIVIDFLEPDTEVFLERIDASLSKGIPQGTHVTTSYAYDPVGNRVGTDLRTATGAGLSGHRCGQARR